MHCAIFIETFFLWRKKVLKEKLLWIWIFVLAIPDLILTWNLLLKLDFKYIFIAGNWAKMLLTENRTENLGSIILSWKTGQPGKPEVSKLVKEIITSLNQFILCCRCFCWWWVRTLWVFKSHFRLKPEIFINKNHLDC